MLPVLEVSGQLHGVLQLSSGVLLKDDSPALNVACVGSVRSTSWSVCSCCQVSFLKDDSPSLNVACVGSVRSTSGGFAAAVMCLFER